MFVDIYINVCKYIFVCVWITKVLYYIYMYMYMYVYVYCCVNAFIASRITSSSMKLLFRMSSSMAPHLLSSSNPRISQRNAIAFTPPCTARHTFKTPYSISSLRQMSNILLLSQLISWWNHSTFSISSMLIIIHSHSTIPFSTTIRIVLGCNLDRQTQMIASSRVYACMCTCLVCASIHIYIYIYLYVYRFSLN